MRQGRWRQYLALLLGAFFLCMSVPSFAQPGGCPAGMVPYAPGINNTCIPNPSKMTIASVLGNPENRLPADVISKIYELAGIQKPVPLEGGDLGYLPLSILGDVNDPRILANLGEITTGAGFNPRETRGADNPFLNNYLPGKPLTELFSAYQRSGVSFANRRVDEVPLLRDKLMELMGNKNYLASGVGGISLSRVLDYARSGGGEPIQALRNALESRVGSLINAKMNELGLDQLFPENFSFFPGALLKDLWNLPIPFEKIRQVADFPIPVWVELANTGTGNLQQTLAGGNVLLNALSGFACPEGGRGGRVDDPSQGRQAGNEARLQLWGNRRTYFRVGGTNTQCSDPNARGLLGALTNFQGRQVVNAWKVTTAGAEFTFQLGMRVAVEGIQYQGRLRLCLTQKPWKDVLGCSANGALAGGFNLPPIALGKSGIIFMPLRDFLQSFLPHPALAISQTDATKILGYVLNFIPRRDLLTYLPDSWKPWVPSQSSREMIPDTP